MIQTMFFFSFIYLFIYLFFEFEDKTEEPHWGMWGEYDTCSMQCGDGYRTRERQCDNPPPRNGKQCYGHRTETSLCRLRRCNPGKKNVVKF